tara:strand:- start:4575 stop:5576 length:1002 start_codon:yes stop_codon:yes gene_type:complete
MKKQPPPFCIQLELTEGCNLACAFCGIASIRDNKANGPKGLRGKNSRPFKFLHWGSAYAVAEKIREACEKDGWNPRIEMAMHGEPTMNPEYKEIVALLREKLPKTHLQMTTNGGGLLKGNLSQNINDLLDAGLNVLLLDNYEGIKICDKVSATYEGPYEILYYPTDKNSNPHRRRRHSEHDIVITEDISIASSGNHATVNNHAGSAFPPNNHAEGRRCAKVFREISIRWDGNVAICCNDWPGRYRCGSVLSGNTLDELWQNNAFIAARKKLYHGQRDFGPCKGCDALSYRPGLLPDLKGKESYGKPNKDDFRHIQTALSKGSYTTAIPRPWEQ